MSQINISDLTFGYDGSFENVFENVSAVLDTDWRLGLTGRNGRGKTTLLRLLSGQLEYSGSISASVDMAYFPPKPSDEGMQTFDVACEVNPQLEFWELCRDLNRLEMDTDGLFRPFDTLSLGERTKVLLAAMLLRENGFLLIDEPTNNLDAHGRELCAQYLSTKKGYILVSHDRSFLDGCVDHIMSINRGGIEVRKGNFSEWYADKEAEDRRELAENARLKKEITALEESARQAAAWSDKQESTKHGERIAGLRPNRGAIGAQAARMMKRSKQIERRRTDAAEERAGLLHNIEKIDDLTIETLSHHAKKLVTLENAAVRYDGRTVLEGVSFEVGQGERIALCGRNGCGKSSLLRMIAQSAQGVPTGGVRTASGLTVSVIEQDASRLSGSLADYAEHSGVDLTRFLTMLRKLEFPRAVFERDMSTFSEGQKKKVLLARSLCTPAHIYIWDEPLNYVDVFSRMQVEEMLLRSGCTMLFVEHDRAFRDRVATRVVEL